jgi:radical SAM superfamily enzyme with C-terminal helix-hairpin-helix motif
VIIELGLSPDRSRQINHLPAGRSFGEGQVDELKTIPRIGDAHAKKIVDGRPYKRKDELVQKG